MSPKAILHRYCDELPFRWDYRKVNDGEKAIAVIEGSEGKRLTYKTSLSVGNSIHLVRFNKDCYNPENTGLGITCYSNNGFKDMEQLTLLETTELRRLPKGKEVAFEPISEGFQLQYKHPNGCLYQGDSIKWLASSRRKKWGIVFADPPYNIKKADWDNFESQEKYI